MIILSNEEKIIAIESLNNKSHVKESPLLTVTFTFIFKHGNYYLFIMNDNTEHTQRPVKRKGPLPRVRRLRLELSPAY